MMGRLEKLGQRMDHLPDRIHNWIFWGLVVLTSIQFLLFRYVSSLDGPQHLYNAYVLKDLCLGNETIRTFYTLNDLPVAYWTSQLLLTMLTCFLPSWLAEKVMILSYVVVLALAYRYFLKSMKGPVDPLARYLIFPFIPSFFFLAGYYAFSFGVACFLWAYGYWFRIRLKLNWKRILKFALLLLFFYFTHGMVFLIFLLTFALQYVYLSILELGESDDRIRCLGSIGKRSMRVILAFIPPIVLLYLYSSGLGPGPGGTGSDDVYYTDLLKQLIRIRPIISFNHQMESIGTVPLFLALVIAGGSVLIGLMIKVLKKGTKLMDILRDKSMVFLLLMILFLGFYFLDPDRFLSGSMTTRAAYFAFLMLIMWLPLMKIARLPGFLLGVTLLFAMLYHQWLMPRYYGPQAKLVSEIQELDKGIEEGSTVFTLRESGNWVHLHFGLYAGLRSHTVHLTNPQCYGPFPILWNKEHVPAMFAGEEQIWVTGLGKVDPATQGRRSVDYLLVFYHDAFLDKEENTKWKEILEQNYEQTILSSGGSAALYRRLIF